MQATLRFQMPSPFALLSRDTLLCVLEKLPPSQPDRRPLLQVLWRSPGLRAAVGHLPPHVYQDLYPQLSFCLSTDYLARHIQSSTLCFTYDAEVGTWDVVQTIVSTRPEKSVVDRAEGIVIDFSPEKRANDQTYSLALPEKRTYVNTAQTYSLALTAPIDPYIYRIDLVSSIQHPCCRREDCKHHPGYYVVAYHPLVQMWRETTAKVQQRQV